MAGKLWPRPLGLVHRRHSILALAHALIPARGLVLVLVLARMIAIIIAVAMTRALARDLSPARDREQNAVTTKAKTHGRAPDP